MNEKPVLGKPGGAVVGADGVPAWVNEMPDGFKIGEFGKRMSLGENMNIRIGGAFSQVKNGVTRYYFPQAQFTYFAPGSNKPTVLLKLTISAFAKLVSFAVSNSADLNMLLQLYKEIQTGMDEVRF